MGIKHMTIKQALQKVADNPELQTDNLVEVPVSELVCRTLFEIANAPSTTLSAQSKANHARSMIFNRLVGRRRPGTHPATATRSQLEFVPLTGEKA